MKKKLEFAIGIIALVEVFHKLMTCPSCEDTFFWINVPGYVYLLLWLFLAILILYGVYKANLGTKRKEKGE